MNPQIKYRFRTTITGKQVLQVLATDPMTSYCRYTGDEHTSHHTSWRDATREEADAVFLLLANKHASAMSDEKQNESAVAPEQANCAVGAGSAGISKPYCCLCGTPLSTVDGDYCEMCLANIESENSNLPNVSAQPRPSA